MKTEMTAYIRISITLLFLTICAYIGSAQDFDVEDKYRFSAGIDIAKPLISMGLEQTAFSFYGHYGFYKALGISINTGYEGSNNMQIAPNVSGRYNSFFAELWFDVKLSKLFWVSAGFYKAQTFNNYTATLEAVNFYPVVRQFEHKQKIEGMVGRISFNDFLTDRISMQFYTDLGLLAQEQISGAFNTMANPGFIEDIGNTLYFGAGLMLGYRFSPRKFIGTPKF